MSAASHRAMPVRCQPVPPVEVALGRTSARTVLPFPLEEPGVVFTYSGTAALYQAFGALRLSRGDAVLCPSYNCGHEIEPLLRLGLDVRCYRVTNELEIDLEDLERRLRSGARAVVITHYFGFPQPLEALRALCDRYGAFLVEDCAHALFSDNLQGNLGRVGDIAVYSMRKTLPIPNGGAMIANNPQLEFRRALRAPPRLTTWLKGAELVAKATLDRFSAQRNPRDLLWLSVLLPLVAVNGAVAAVHPRASTACYNPDDEDYGFSIDIMSWRMSGYSEALMRRIDLCGIPERRRSNYRALVGALGDGVQPLFPVLPEDVCPLYLPVRVERPLDVYHALADKRIFADVFWPQAHTAVDWAQFPEARELKQHVLALPVHQDVDERQLDRLVHVLRAR